MSTEPAQSIKLNPIVLHVGCGANSLAQTTPEFRSGKWREIRLDIDPGARPDLIASITDMRSVADGSVDAIYSSHNIEHLYPHEVPKAFSEFLRVLAPQGYAVITCPDLKTVCESVALDRLLEPLYQSKAGPVSPIDVLYGFRSALKKGNLFMAHHCGFTIKTLVGTLRACGFKTVVGLARPKHFDLWTVASKPKMPDADIKRLLSSHLPA